MTIEELLAATGLTENDLVPIYDAEAAQNVEPTQKVTATQLAAAVKVLASLVNTTEMASAIQQSTASGEVVTVYGTYCKVQKKAGVVYVYGNSSGGQALTGDADWHSLTTIPSGYRPANTVYFAGASANGKGLSFRINTSGVVEYVAGTGNTTSYWSYGASYICT